MSRQTMAAPPPILIRISRSIVASAAVRLAAVSHRVGAWLVPTWLVPIWLAAITLVMAPAVMASAQSYPDRPIRIVVPFTAGSPNDVVARVIAAPLSVRLGQPVVI